MTDLEKRRAIGRAWRLRHLEKVKAYQKEYRAKNKDRIKQQAAERRLTHPDIVKANRRRNYDKHIDKKLAYSRAYYASRKSPEKCILDLARQRAKKKGILFDLVETDIFIPENCPVLGIKLERAKRYFSASSPTLDRINLNLGYVGGNVKVISWRANNLKRDATVGELRAVLKYMEESGAL